MLGSQIFGVAFAVEIDVALDPIGVRLFCADTVMSRSFGLPLGIDGGNVLSMKLVDNKLDDRMPAEIDDCWSPLITTLGRLI
jgi:hypothetical protein